VQDVREAVPSNDLIRVDRRRYPRLHLVGELNGLIVPFQIGVRVIDISASGFAVRSPLEFATGTAHEFQFALLHRPRPIVRAVVVHSRRVTSRRGRPFFVAGFAFLDLSDRARATIDEIVADIDHSSSAEPAATIPAAELPGVDAAIKYK
jgi:hypothetical protein